VKTSYFGVTSAKTPGAIACYCTVQAHIWCRWDNKSREIAGTCNNNKIVLEKEVE
jgi:hypothetical protein